MKIIKLVLFGILSVHCQESTTDYYRPAPTTSTEPPTTESETETTDASTAFSVASPAPTVAPMATLAPVAPPPQKSFDTKGNKYDSSSENTLLRISDHIASHARLTIGLSLLALFVKPDQEESDVHEAISILFNFNHSVIDGLMKVDHTQAVRVIKDLAALSVDGVKEASPLSRIKRLEYINEQLAYLPPLADENTRSEVLQTIEQWRTFEPLNTDELKNWHKQLKNMDSFFPVDDNDIGIRSYLTNAVEALEKFPASVEEMVSRMSQFKLPIVMNQITETLGPLNKRLEIYKSVPSASVKSFAKGNVKQIGKLCDNSTLFRTAADVARAIRIVSDSIAHETNEGSLWSGVFPKGFLKLEYLAGDFENPHFAKPLNKDGSVALLKTIIEPVYKPSDSMMTFWTKIEEAFKKPEVAHQARDMDDLLKYLLAAGGSDVGFTNHLTTIIGLLNKTKTLDNDEFSKAYGSLMDGLKDFRKFDADLQEMLNSNNYKQLSSNSALIMDLRKTTTKDAFNSFYTNAVFQSTEARLENITNNLDTLNGKIKKFQTNLNAELKNIVDKTEKWIKSDFEPFYKGMKKIEPSVASVKSGLKFVQKHNQVFKAPAPFQPYELAIQGLEKALGSAKEQIKKLNAELKGLADMSSPNGTYYHYLIVWKEEYQLKEKLVSGSVLFGLFHELVKQNGFKELFSKTDALKAKIQGMPLETAGRYDWIQKLKKLEVFRGRVEELLGQIKLRKKRYDGKPIRELLGLRWLMENLHDVTNPEFKTQEWRDLAEELVKVSDLSSDATDFAKSIDNAFDLDFANHQKHVVGTFANYRGLVRYHEFILLHELVQNRTFYEWYRPYFELFYVFVGTVILNGALYGSAIWYLKKKEKEEEIREKEREMDHMHFTSELLDNPMTDSEEEPYYLE